MFNIELSIEMARRVQPDGEFWRPNTVALATEAGQQKAYCLDAVDEIPAGGMYGEEFCGMMLSMPLTVHRGA